MSSSGRGEEAFARSGVAPQRHHVVDVEEVEVYQDILYRMAVEAAADQMGNHLHVVTFHDGRRQCHRSGAFS